MVTPIEWIWVPFDVDRRFDGYRVDRFLAQRLAAYTRSRVQKILQESRVMRADRPMKASAKVRGGDRILIAYPRRPEAPLPADATLPILYEDESLLVINKPADLLSHATDRIQQHTVPGLLRHCRPDLKTIHLLHRLDRETSGVLVLGKNRTVARAWTEAMERREIKKDYLAVVRGVPKARAGTISWPIGRELREIKIRQWINAAGAVPAVTRYHVLACTRDLALVQASPETGRLHQIRVHLAALGHPLLGDVLYTGDGVLYLKRIGQPLTEEERENLGFHRLCLHAARIRFDHPVSQKTVDVSAPLPGDLRAFLAARGISKIDTLSSR